ncbi:ankyrin [Whalleya microplaca]|nr:ankyrin [Whalleya microplaca]
MAAPNPSRSLALPSELLVDICGYLSLHDIKNWSLACQHFYFHILPILHSTDSRKQHRASYWACQHGRLDILEASLDAGTNVNHAFPRLTSGEGDEGDMDFQFLSPPECFPTLLHVAAYYDQIKTIEFLISRGANITTSGWWHASCMDFHCNPPIYFVRSPDAVNLLVSGVDNEWLLDVTVNVLNDWVSLPTIETLLSHVHDAQSLVPQDLLEVACQCRRLDVFDFVVRHLHINLETNNELDPIIMICFLLLNRDLPIDERNLDQLLDRVLTLPGMAYMIDDRATIIDRTIHSPHCRKCGGASMLMMSLKPFVPVSVTRRFLRMGMDTHQRCCWPSFPKYRTQRRFSVAKLVEASPILMTKWQKRGTALGYGLSLMLIDGISQYGRQFTQQKVQLLLEHGAGFEAKGYPVSFLLMTVAWPFSANKTVDCIQSLGDIIFRQRNKFGETHLSSMLSWVWCRGGRKQKNRTKDWLPAIVRLVYSLLRSDQSKTYITTPATGGPSKGLLPIEVVCRAPLGQKCCVYCNDQGFEVNVLLFMDTLLKHGSCANTKDATGRSLLHKAAASGAHGRVRLLIKHGAKVDDVDNHNYTALHHACHIDVEDPDPAQSLRRVNIVKQLIEDGADINAKTDEGLTPLLLACRALDELLVESLLSVGALILDDNYGRSPQDAAELADERYQSFQLSSLGAMSSMLFDYGDVDYVYDPKEPILNMLADLHLTEQRLSTTTRDFSKQESLWHVFEEDAATLDEGYEDEYEDSDED